MIYETREQWLTAAAARLSVLFTEQRHRPEGFSNLRVSCGFPSVRAMSSKNRAIGQAWQVEASSDKTAEVFVSPCLDDPVQVLGVLAHELVHVATPGEGHKKAFSSMGREIGLEGKPTSMSPGAELTERLNTEFVEALGPYPHGKLSGTVRGAKKQGTRMIKAWCEQTDYTVRLSQKWIDTYGPPVCPCCREIMSV